MDKPIWEMPAISAKFQHTIGNGCSAIENVKELQFAAVDVMRWELRLLAVELLEKLRKSNPASSRYSQYPECVRKK